MKLFFLINCLFSISLINTFFLNQFWKSNLEPSPSLPLQDLGENEKRPVELYTRFHGNIPPPSLSPGYPRERNTPSTYIVYAFPWKHSWDKRSDVQTKE